MISRMEDREEQWNVYELLVSFYNLTLSWKNKNSLHKNLFTQYGVQLQGIPYTEEVFKVY